jgi:hypothetical protein
MTNRRFEAVPPTLSIYRPDQLVLSSKTANQLSRSALKKAIMRLVRTQRMSPSVQRRNGRFLTTPPGGLPIISDIPASKLMKP